MIQAPIDADLDKAVAGDLTAQRAVNDLRAAAPAVTLDMGGAVANALRNTCEAQFVHVTSRPPLPELMALCLLVAANVVAAWLTRAGFNQPGTADHEGRIKGAVAFFEAGLRAALSSNVRKH